MPRGFFSVPTQPAPAATEVSMNRAALKARTRASIRWATTGVLFVGMTYWFISMAVQMFAPLGFSVTLAPTLSITFSFGFGSATQIIATGLSIVVALVLNILSAGYLYAWPLAISRNEKTGVRSLFALTRQPGRFIALPLATGALTGAPLVPAGLSLAVAIRDGGPALDALRAGLSQATALTDIAALQQGFYAAFFPWHFWVLLAVGAVLSLWLFATYGQAMFLAIDHPDASIGAVFRGSRRVMRGRKTAFLLLILSFIPWFLPGFFCTGGIYLSGTGGSSSWLMLLLAGFAMLMSIWAVTYAQAASANFYCLITGKLSVKNTPPEGALSLMRMLFTHTRPEDDPPDEKPDTPEKPDNPDEKDTKDDDKPSIEDMWKR
jgi:uncharacterized membrane protein